MKYLQHIFIFLLITLLIGCTVDLTRLTTPTVDPEIQLFYVQGSNPGVQTEIPNNYVLDFGKLIKDNTYDFTFRIKNSGTTPLKFLGNPRVEQISDPAHKETTHKDDYSQLQVKNKISVDALDPGNTQDFLISIKPTMNVDYQSYAAFQILTNDVDESTFITRLRFVTGS